MNNAVVVGLVSCLTPKTRVPTFLEEAQGKLGTGRLAFVLYRLTGMIQCYEEMFPFKILDGVEWCQDLVHLLTLSADLNQMFRIKGGELDYRETITPFQKEEFATYVALNTPFPPRV
jgi:hypothetical protein